MDVLNAPALHILPKPIIAMHDHAGRTMHAECCTHLWLTSAERDTMVTNKLVDDWSKPKLNPEPPCVYAAGG